MKKEVKVFLVSSILLTGLARMSAAVWPPATSLEEPAKPTNVGNENQALQNPHVISDLRQDELELRAIVNGLKKSQLEIEKLTAVLRSSQKPSTIESKK